MVRAAMEDRGRVETKVKLRPFENSRRSGAMAGGLACALRHGAIATWNPLWFAQAGRSLRMFSGRVPLDHGRREGLNEGFILRLEKAGGRAGEAAKASRISIRDPERRIFCAATGSKAKRHRKVSPRPISKDRARRDEGAVMVRRA